LGNSVMESFFDEYILRVVAYKRYCGPLVLHRKRGRASFRGQVSHTTKVSLALRFLISGSLLLLFQDGASIDDYLLFHTLGF
jgi:hypothetical protein